MSAPYILYHYPISPFSRKVRLVLAEKNFEFTLREERYWERREGFWRINPSGKVPVLCHGRDVFADSQAICEYLEMVAPEGTVPLFPDDPKEQCEVRRLIAYFDEKFYQEVTQVLLFERMLRRVQKQGFTNERQVRSGLEKYRRHMKYIKHLIDNRRWIAGSRMTLADFTVAAHLSCLDYVGDIQWDDEDLAGVKGWYSAIKSRPAFRPILSDHVPGYVPPRHYAHVDF